MSKSQREETPRLSAGEKILLLRKHNHLSQIDMAEIMKVRPDRIVKVEKGEAEYAQAHIDAVKEHFGIVGLPLTEQESIVFKERLYYWRTLLRANKMDEAKVIHNEVFNIDNLEPCDYNMVVLCKMIEVLHLMMEGRYVTAEKILNEYERFLYKMNTENQFHYNKSKGFLHLHKVQYEESLKFYLKAYELLENHENVLPEDDERLYYNIAYCYDLLEIPSRAIFFLQKAKNVQAEHKQINFFLDIDHMLAINYVKLGQHNEAKKLLNKCLIKAESIKDSIYYGSSLFALGYMYRKIGQWETAINYLDNAIKVFPKEPSYYCPVILNKIYCTIQAREFTKANELLLCARDRCGKDELWLVYFKSLWHYCKISVNMSTNDNSASIEYIEDVAIPRFIKENDYFIAIDYYTLLEQHYEKLSSTRKSLLMAKAIRDIYKRCYANHGRDD